MLFASATITCTSLQSSTKAISSSAVTIIAYTHSNICPNSFSFSLGGNSLSNSSPYSCLIIPHSPYGSRFNSFSYSDNTDHISKNITLQSPIAVSLLQLFFIIAESYHFLLQQPVHICHEKSIRYRMIQADAHRHHKSSVFLTVFSPVDDRSKMQISVRQLNI